MSAQPTLFTEEEQRREQEFADKIPHIVNHWEEFYRGVEELIDEGSEGDDPFLEEWM